MEIEDESANLWIRLKCYVFMKLGYDLWKYVIVHENYWHKPYGISFTHRPDFPKLLKYDMVNMNDDLELEMEKNR
jgi:hypothetical protein